MKFLVKNPIFDTKTEKTYLTGEVFDVTAKRLEEIKETLEQQGGFDLYLEELTNETTSEAEVTEE
ncbi:hypothetical protein [Gemella haemolysans]|jgi:hypothetical protein|uniref:Uncharacterized protein n=2 Tax=Gemella haemolysans TaxID=1379 RepID=A0AA87AJP2_9BACL|nr:hypothetical protein [Gemella haemolysans]EGF86017.1 hypothetical protein HMPREF0428_01819 [Gemella haemolysans M341]QIX87304.1 hypothetical protein FOC48_00320 [Gemella haemolysans]DAU15927.1 MAG TPA: hypothetical protein [Caudoviricetes sp.]